METLILIVHVLAAITIIGLVLLQHGKGADMGAAFGGGASGSLFGATGSANFLSRATAVLATVFFLTSLGLTWYSAHKTESKGVMSTTQPASQVPGQVPGQVPDIPPASVPATSASDKPAADADSKVRDIPK